MPKLNFVKFYLKGIQFKESFIQKTDHLVGLLWLLNPVIQ